jgi:hypothetical protein
MIWLYRYAISMPNQELIRPTLDGLLLSLSLLPCDALVLKQVLNRAIPFVWLHRHFPSDQVKWWKAAVPICNSGKSRILKIRRLEFDMQMPLEEFLQCLSEFKESGLDLFQMAHEVPDTLHFKPEDANMNRILISNGLFLSFNLPHRNECASIKCTDKSYLEQLLTNEVVKSLAYVP